MSDVVNLEGQEVAKFDWPEQVNGHIVRMEREIELIASLMQMQVAINTNQNARILLLEKKQKRWWHI